MQNKNNSTTKYQLATAGKRIIAKVIDIAIISCLIVGLGFAIFCTDANFAWGKPLELDQNWRYGLFVTLMAFIFFSLMLVLPRLWGKTIGMKVCSLAYYHKEKSFNYTFGLFKHELFIWVVVVLIALAMGWTLSFMTQHQIQSLFDGANAIFANKVPDGTDKVCYYVGTGFACLYGISILFLIAIIIAICIKNGKPAFHDKYSHIYVYSNKPYTEKYISVNEYKKQQQEKGNVPGAISMDSLEEIDNL